MLNTHIEWQKCRKEFLFIKKIVEKCVRIIYCVSFNEPSLFQISSCVLLTTSPEIKLHNTLGGKVIKIILI